MFYLKTIISVRENRAALCISLTNLARLKSFTHGKTLRWM